MEMTLSQFYLTENLTILETLGFPKHCALEAMEISNLDSYLPTHRFDLVSFQSCLDAAAIYTADENIGLRLGDKLRVGTFGQTGVLYSYCDDLREVMLMNNLYQKVAIDAGEVVYLQGEDGSHHMCFRPHYADLQKYRFITDVIMASYVTTYRWLSWGSGEDIMSVRLPYVSAAQQPKYVELLGLPVVLDSDKICMEFSEVAMTQKITTRDPERLSHMRLILDKMIGEQTATHEFVKSVEAAIRGALETGHVSSQIVADRMGVSQSNLRARLAETEKGIRVRVDMMRQTIFMERVRAGHSLSQIAHALAYNDQAAMNRAFRRWYGMSPTQWLVENPSI